MQYWMFSFIDISIRYMIGHDPRKTVLIIVHSLSRFLCMDWSGSKIILKYDIVMLNQMSVRYFTVAMYFGVYLYHMYLFHSYKIPL